jgi:MFS transporter, SP family, sugar:H+ symporter
MLLNASPSSYKGRYGLSLITSFLIRLYFTDLLTVRSLPIHRDTRPANMDTNTRGFFRNFNGRLLYTVSILMLSQINFGADISTFSSTQAMDAFEKRFGQYNPETDSYALNPVYLSLLNSLTYIGQVAGVLLGGYIGRKKGRKWSLYVMCFWAILSAVLLVSAKSRAQLLVGRILNYIYIGQELVTVPVFQAEVVPPHVRGFVVATYQLGSIVSAFCVLSHISY